MDAEIIIKSLFTVIAAVLGGLIVFGLRLDHKKLCMLISLSAGALLGAGVFTMLPEAATVLPPVTTLGLAVTGFGLFWIISKYVFHICPACSASHFDEQTTKKFSEIVYVMFTVLAFHSFLDGAALTAGLMRPGSSGHGAIFTAILTHKVPEGLALASLMLGAGYGKRRILELVTIVESATFAGAVASYYFFAYYISPVLLALVEAHVAGGFIFLALHALQGEVFKNHKGLVLGSFTGGLGIILAVTLLFH